jgi:hypothetical protein
MSRRRPCNVVDLPIKPIAHAVGTGATATVTESGVVDRLIKQAIAAYMRELELQSAFDGARRARKALIRQLAQLPGIGINGPVRSAVDEAGSPR